MKIFLILLILSTPALSQNQVVTSFGKAKAELRKIYTNKNQTFYCDCAYQKKSIKSKCKLLISKFKKRQKRLEWEHVVPAHSFGNSFVEWRNSKKFCPGKKNSKGIFKSVSNRKCASKKNKLFRYMESDLYNLVPAVGAINAIRSNFSMAEFIGGEKLCSADFRVLERKVMPSPRRRGDIARIYQYMNLTYPGRGIISKKNKAMYERWSLNDPVDKEECSTYYKKKNFQKSLNPILESLCLKK